MQPVLQDIYVYRGDSFDFFFTVYNRVWDAGTSTYVRGTAKDLTGWTGISQIRATEDAAEPLVNMTVTITDQAVTPGGVLISMTPVQTQPLPTTGGKWDVQLTSNTGAVRTFYRGAVLVDKDVSRV